MCLMDGYWCGYFGSVPSLTGERILAYSTELPWSCLFYSHEEIAAKFDELDKDGNGVLSPDEVLGVIREYMGYDERMASCMIKMFDQNQDGSLDKTEFMNMWTSMFGEH